LYHYRIVGTPNYSDYGLRNCAVPSGLTGSPRFPLRTSGIVCLFPYRFSGYRHRHPIPELSLPLSAARYARRGETFRDDFPPGVTPLHASLRFASPALKHTDTLAPSRYLPSGLHLDLAGNPSVTRARGEAHLPKVENKLNASMKDITIEQLFRALNAALHHCGTLPDEDEGAVRLDHAQIKEAASWLYEELKGD